MKLRLVKSDEISEVMDIINMAKKHLKDQRIDQWQTSYPDYACIEEDIKNKKGYFIVENGNVLGYLCADYDKEPAYKDMKGTWNTSEDYVVVHRMAFTDSSRGKGISDIAFRLVEEMSKEKGINSFRVDTDSDNEKMKHILYKNGFSYCGTICFDNSEKIAFDKMF